MHEKIAVLYHIFYEDSYEDVVAELSGLKHLNVIFFFNISAETPNQLEIKQKLVKQFPKSYVTISSNKGKDIGGKLLLLSLCMQLEVKPDWIVFLHDKKSHQALNAKTWKNDLLKIINKDEIEKIEKIITSSSNCGIIAAEGYVMEEVKAGKRIIGKNGDVLSILIDEYKINCKRYTYVAGTMFWVRASALMDFFQKNNPLQIRQTLETGNVLDNFSSTYTHSWERMLSWIVVSQGLLIKTV